MEKKTVVSFLEKIRTESEKEQYPEITNLVQYALDFEDCYLMEEPEELADQIFKCDSTKILPYSAAQLIIQIYQEEINNGNAEAATNLGSLYYTGRIGVQDYRKAEELYKLAADQGERQAQENLGYCYYYGRNGESNYEKAFHYFALGAFDGHLRSLYKIGDMYRFGYYVEKSEIEAYRIYSRCYDTLTEKAIPLVGADIMMRMGDCFFEGVGVERDYEKALDYYQQAERLFYRRIMEGDYLIRKCYERVMERQVQSREKLKQQMPEYDWIRK